MASHYPHGDSCYPATNEEEAKIDARETQEKLGGELLNPMFAGETCAIRVSHSLNLAGHPLPADFCLTPDDRWLADIFGPGYHAHPEGGYMRTRSGGGPYAMFRYAFQVKELRNYLVATFGPPERTLVMGAGLSQAGFADLKGIMVFLQRGAWPAPLRGHIDLWDGQRNYGYSLSSWPYASEIQLFAAPP